MSRFTDKIDMRFKYVPASKTNIAATIARERRRLAEAAAKQKAEAEAITIEQTLKLRALRK